MLPEMLGEHPSAREAYDRFAPVYDEFNAQNDYEVWLGEVLLPELEKHGLRVGHVLDIGCGTGRAFDPLWRRRWNYWGCDISIEMLRVARAGAASGEFFQADARNLPDFPPDFRLILALNDVVNYLTEDGDLERAFEGMKRNLARGGLVCFDANCLSLFEANWIAGEEAQLGERGLDWRGLTTTVEPGGVYEAEAAAEGMEAHLHRERHWPRQEVEDAMSSAGLRVLDVRGLREDMEAHQIFLDPDPDEYSHPKVIYIGGHDG